jgi:ribonuclease R
VHHRLAGERTGRSFRLGDTVEVRVMRVDLDERKIDFEMAEKTIAAPIGRKRRGGHETTPAPVEKQSAAPSKAPSKRPAKAKAKAEPEAYRPSDAAAKNAEVRKSRELKQALLAEAKGGSKAPSGKSSNSGSASSGSAPGGSGKPAKSGKHRKGPPKAGSAPAAKSGGVRKPKAKS